MQKLIQRCFDYGRLWHLSFGVNKCKVVTQRDVKSVFTNKNGDHSFKLGILDVEITSKPYCYLGREDDGTLKLSQEFISRRTKSFNSSLRRINYVNYPPDFPLLLKTPVNIMFGGNQINKGEL